MSSPPPPPTHPSKKPSDWNTARIHVNIERTYVCVCVCVCVYLGRHLTDVRCYDEIRGVEDLSVPLFKVSIPFAFLLFCRVFSVAWGRTSCVPQSRKRYQLRPKVSASWASVASRFVNLTAKKMYQLRPKGSASCVSYRDTTKPHERTGKRTCSAARNTTHTTQRHHPTSKVSTFSTSSSTWNAWYFEICFLSFGSNFNV